MEVKLIQIPYYDKSYLDLKTAVDAYAPDILWRPAAHEWRTETIDLTGYSSTQTIFRFIQENGFWK